MTGQGIQSLFHCLHVKIVAEIMNYPTRIIILIFFLAWYCLSSASAMCPGVPWQMVWGLGGGFLLYLMFTVWNTVGYRVGFSARLTTCRLCRLCKYSFTCLLQCPVFSWDWSFQSTGFLSHLPYPFISAKARVFNGFIIAHLVNIVMGFMSVPFSEMFIQVTLRSWWSLDIQINLVSWEGMCLEGLDT